MVVEERASAGGREEGFRPHYAAQTLPLFVVLSPIGDCHTPFLLDTCLFSHPRSDIFAPLLPSLLVRTSGLALCGRTDIDILKQLLQRGANRDAPAPCVWENQVPRSPVELAEELPTMLLDQVMNVLEGGDGQAQ